MQVEDRSIVCFRFLALRAPTMLEESKRGINGQKPGFTVTRLGKLEHWECGLASRFAQPCNPSWLSKSTGFPPQYTNRKEQAHVSSPK
jgi:hypothetical protein